MNSKKRQTNNVHSPCEGYPGFLLFCGTYDIAPATKQKNVHCVLFFTYYFESLALILATKSRL